MVHQIWNLLVGIVALIILVTGLSDSTSAIQEGSIALIAIAVKLIFTVDSAAQKLEETNTLLQKLVPQENEENGDEITKQCSNLKD
jgi:choline-glycine betaine transporter